MSSEVVYVLVRRISLSTLVWYYSVPNFLLMIFFRSFVSDLLCRFEKKVFFSEVLAHRILRYAFLASLLAYDLEKCEHASRMRAISCEETRKNASLASARMAPFCARALGVEYVQSSSKEGWCNTDQRGNAIDAH